MTTEVPSITEAQCGNWRDALQAGTAPYELAAESGVSRQTVIDHITGECSHDGGHDAVLSSYSVSAEECRDLRLQYEGAHTIDDLLDESGRRWGTLIRHLTGECSHTDVEAPTVTKETILRRDQISAEDCDRFRRGVQEAGNVMEFANTVEVEYQVVLAHVNGECSHETETPQREPDDRRRDISRSECRAIRQAYRSDLAIDLADLASEYGCSTTTVDRHVHFRCTHPPDDALVTDVDAVQDLLGTPSEPTTPQRLHPSEIAALDGVTNGDRAEASHDLADPDPDRVATTRSRIIRNTDLAHDLKTMYAHTCQVCSEQRYGATGAPYAEAHHIRPLGEPHTGPDEPGNILVLCPNHHADFDYGQLTVDPETYCISHAYDDAVDGTELTVAEAHDISSEQLLYHNEVIAMDTQQSRDVGE